MLFKKSQLLIGATCLMLGVYGQTVFSGDEKTIDDYIDEARPYLHLSCQGAWAASGENEDEYVAIMNRFISIAFINHDFDVQQIYDAPEADQKELQVIFYNDIGKRCAKHPGRLLSGIVERSLEYALLEMDKKGG